MSDKFKTVTVKLPDPEFVSPKTLRETATRRYIQGRLLFHLTSSESLFRELLSRMHGRALIEVIGELMNNEGVESESAEGYMMRIVDEFRLHSPLEMFLHYMATEDVDKAEAHYRFLPMQFRFLEISTVADGVAVRVKCNKDRYLVDEFDFLCEELGLRYRSNQPAAVVPDSLDLTLHEVMSGKEYSKGLSPLSIKDIVSGCTNCGGEDGG
jgi:hypothetical protein